mmetsp:Transcript_18426/g.40292  ORF Transcript_18426/g.40292 Transcript_18426/m.40292 type:complete len:950 (+) Transcript_18426:73-2922(+)
MAVKNNVLVLSFRQQVVFPALRTSISVTPQTFTELCDLCEKNDTTPHVAIFAVKSSGKNGDKLYDVGTYCKVASHTRSTAKSGNQELSVVTLSIEGVSRFRVQKFVQTKPFRIADIELIEEQEDANASVEIRALEQTLQQLMADMLKESAPQERSETGAASGFLRNLFVSGKQRIRWPPSAGLLADMVGAGMPQLVLAERQQVLETIDLKARLELVVDLVRKGIEVQRVSREINLKMQRRTEDELRETILRRQLQEVQKEMRRLKGGKGAKSADKGGKTASSGEDAENGEEEEEEEVEEEQEEEEDDFLALRESLKKQPLSADARKIANRELKRLQNIQPGQPEYTVCRTYLETLASLPWDESSKDGLDLAAARQILDADHHGLEKVKRRVLEFLAVQKMRGDMHGPILCLHGPPGVGKTSLGRSIAKALGRKFHRLALGGVRDEAEIRGHRRTYIGSMPGAIIQALMQLKVNNPVILLDEVDKITRNAMFNPSGALLELLDPEQNHTFKDHYLNTQFDLSKVLFLCTANDLNAIDRPLLDRMEVIELSGYTVEEKVHIATTHLLPKQRKLHALEKQATPEPHAPEPEPEAVAESGGLLPQGLSPPESDGPLLEMSRMAISDLITKWTMESGVRSLERRVAQICRWAALRLAGPQCEGVVAAGDDREVERASELAECGPNAQGRLFVEARHLPFIVGMEMFEPDLAERLSVGVAMGLAVTSTGGQLLFVEATRHIGSGKLTVTGQLGDVMRESVSTAMSLLRSMMYRGTCLESTRESGDAVRDTGAGADPGVFQQLLARVDAGQDPFGNDDIHVHFPAGATPKDGPSAGVATTLALASLLLGRPVRSDTAVTGEITLRGHVLPVGGIRDKVLAAHRAGIRHILLPFANQRHVKDDIPAAALSEIEVHFVKHVDEALTWAFASDNRPWTPATPAASPGPAAPALSLRSKL